MTREPELGQPIDFNASGVSKRLDAFARLIRVSGEHLLDVGCGNGAYTLAMANSFERVDAIDVEPVRIAALSEEVAERGLQSTFSVHLMSAADLAFADGTFDVVTAIEVLEHLPDLPRSLAEVRRVMRDDGVLLVTVPNRLFPLETHSVVVAGRRFPGRRLPFLPYVPPLHARWSEARTFTTRTLAATMRAAGFAPSATTHVMPPFDRWSNGRRVLKPVTDRLEASPLAAFGVSIVMACRKQ